MGEAVVEIRSSGRGDEGKSHRTFLRAPPEGGNKNTPSGRVSTTASQSKQP
jgi:hypothetical protein